MSLISIIVVLAVVGLLVWAIEQIPMDPAFRNAIRVVAIVIVCLWLLQAFGLLGDIGTIRLR